MKVYLLMYVPFGAPAHDTDVLGVYATKTAANKVLKVKVKAEEYDGEELFVVMRNVEA